MKGLERYRTWFLAARPWSFIMTFFCVTTGSIAGTTDTPFSWLYYILTLLGVLFLHGSANLLNDYFDVASGVDSTDVATARYRPHPLAEGSLSLSAVGWTAAILLIPALIIGVFLALTLGWPVFVLGLAGLLAGVFYTAPPFRYKYSAMGELAAFLIWGPLMVTGASYVQTQSREMDLILISIPLGMLVALVLLANNIRDMESDRQRNIHTVPILLGERTAVVLFLVLIVLAYLSVTLMSLLGPLAAWSLLVLLSLPFTVNLAREVLKAVPIDADERTAQAVTVFGALLLLSLLMGNVL